MGWEQVIYLIIATLISIALAPKPPKPKAASLEDFDIPTAEEGRPIPVVFGTCRITGSNVLWHGDMGTEAIKKKSLFSSTTIGYKYFLSFHFGLCHGPVDSFLKFEAGEKLAWSGNATANTTLTINKGDLFGGKKREGGLKGVLDVCMGAPGQAINSYLDEAIGRGIMGFPPNPANNIPAFRGIMGLVWRGDGPKSLFSAIFNTRGGYIGTTPYVKPFAFTVKRVTAGWHGGTVWYSAKAAIGTGMNPAHIVYQTLTDPEWGMGMPADKLDEASFTAAADLLHSEGFGLSLLWNQQASIEDFLGEVLDHCAGVLGFDRTTGKYRIKLIRGDYDAGTLPSYGPETISRVSSFQRQAWGETVNELTLKFTDGTTLQPTSVTVHDLANVRAQNVRVASNVSMPGITDKTIAQKVAIRELTARSTPLAKITFLVNRDLWATKGADVIKVSWPVLGIEDMVVRVLRVRQGTLANGEIEVEGVEDIYAIALTTYTTQPDPGGDDEVEGWEEPPDEGGASVISTTLTTPPATPADGDSYLVPPGATGAWAGHEGEVATWDVDEAGGTSGWVFTAVGDGTVITDATTGNQVQVTGGVAGATAWTPAIPPLTTATPDPAADHIVFFDASANAYRKTLASLGGGGGGGGGVGSGGVYGCVLKFTTDLSLPVSTWVPIQWETAERDDADYWDVADPTKIYAPRDGYYLVTAAVNFAVGDVFTLAVRKNGALEVDSTYHGQRLGIGTGVNERLGASFVLYLVAGDYVELVGNSRDGGDSMTEGRVAFVSLLGSYSSPLIDTVLATSPVAYWTCDETAGGILVDATGNGHDLTLTGSYIQARSPLVPSEPSKKFLYLYGGTGRADAADALGLAMPFDGDYTFAVIVSPASSGRIASMCSVTGESAATNYQLGPQVTVESNFTDFHENGSGTDNISTVSQPPRQGEAQLVIFQRDSAAKNIIVWKNAIRMGTVAYANNPTGGDAVNTKFRLGGDVDGNMVAGMFGHAAFWDRLLSVDEIVAITQAAGFFNVGGAGGGSVSLGGGGTGYPLVLGYAGI